MKNYIISFGDSAKYRVSFDGTRDEFEKSDKLLSIREKVNDYLKKEFPADDYEAVTRLNVNDDDGGDYESFDDAGIGSLLESVKTQVEVELDTEELNNNAPYDQL